VACLHCSLRGCRSGGVPVTQQATAAAADLATVWLVENPLLTGPCAAHIPAVVCPAGQELLAGRTICTACPAGTVNPTPGGTCSTTCTAPKVANQAGTECGGCWAWLACTAACVGAAQHGCLSHSRRRQRRRWRRHQRTGAEQRLMMGRCTAPTSLRAAACAAECPAGTTCTAPQCLAGKELLTGGTSCTDCPAGTVNPTPGGTCSTTCTAPKVANQARTECGGCWAWLPALQPAWVPLSRGACHTAGGGSGVAGAAISVRGRSSA